MYTNSIQVMSSVLQSFLNPKQEEKFPFKSSENLISIELNNKYTQIQSLSKERDNLRNKLRKREN